MMNSSENSPSSKDGPQSRLKVTKKYEDPVKIQKKSARIESTLISPKISEDKTNKPPEMVAQITPSLGTRMIYRNPVNVTPTYQKSTYLTPMYRQKKIFEKNRANTYKQYKLYHCNEKFAKQTTNLAKPHLKKTVSGEYQAPSPEISSAKVAPRNVTPTASWLHPDPQSSAELKLHKPKSGILINVKNEQMEGSMDVYDSFDLVFKRKPRPERKKGRKREKTRSLEDIKEETKKHRKKKKANKRLSTSGKENIKDQEEQRLEDENIVKLFEEGDPEGAGDFEEYLTKQFRKKVSQMSHSTSYQVADYLDEEDRPKTPELFARYVQKFRRDSEVRKHEPEKRKFKKGTLESHSFNDVRQEVPRDFYFGSKSGTMHYDDPHIPPEARTMQGICIPVAAYCYSFIKHPNRWTSEIIDEILDVGTNLYLTSLSSLHVHRPGKELRPEDLEKYCLIGNKKIRFVLDEPEISGFLKSADKTVFNITKALKIFFSRQKAGVLQTQNTNIALWKDKYFYFFDGKPRTKDLCYDPEHGTAVLGNFYDISSIVSVLLERSSMQNWPFVIYPVKVYKILNKDEEDEPIDDLGLESRSQYNILNENKAILLGSYDLGDKCFGFTRNKQSLAIAVVCLVYSRITPPSTWHRTTVDKIMILGNQLYIECMECAQFEELSIFSLPAFFTIGPYIIEIHIFVNRKVDMMYKKCTCQLTSAFQEFFKTNTNGVLQLKKKYLAVWKQRNMIFCFDPYPRGVEGFSSRDGYACVSMHVNLESLVNVISTNFDDKDIIFNLHAMKVCKIHRDPVQSQQFPKHIPLDEFSADDFREYKMKKSKKKATERPVTVDYTALAMKTLLIGETPDPSIFEIGSTVESLTQEQIPPIMRDEKMLAKLKKLQKAAPMTDVIADLDSPSLSDTQIDPERLIEPKDVEELPFMDLDSFEITQDELEMAEVVAGEDYEEGEMEDAEEEMEDMNPEEVMQEEMETEFQYEMEDAKDFYFEANKSEQVRAESLMPLVVTEEVNTELTYFPIHKEVLYPTYVRDKQYRQTKWDKFKEGRHDGWDDFVPDDPEITKSQELSKETNFIDLPDDTQIIRGTKNLSHFGEEMEFMAPYVSIVANIVSKKYSILSWTTEIVDYILKCGAELREKFGYRFDQVEKLDFPQISLGKSKFSVKVEYIFDSSVRQNLLDLAIEKILFVRSDMGVLVTPTYACALIRKNHLYYMFDAFGNNEVGLNVENSHNGVACFTRFKDIHSLTTRIMYNKRKREEGEEVAYSRFVLSMVRVKVLKSQQEIKRKKHKKERDGKKMVDGDLEKGEDSSTEWIELKTEGETPRDEAQDPRATGHKHEYHQAHRHKPRSKRCVGYLYRRGLWVIEGTRALQPYEPSTTLLHEDHFTCLCACLMLLSLPVDLWDTVKMDEVLDYGNYVYSHADELEVSEKRTIKNMLIGKNFFDIIVKKIKIENWHDNQNLGIGMDTLYRKKINHYLIQFGESCFLFYHSSNGYFHLFMPQGVPQKTDSKKNKEVSSSSELESDQEEQQQNKKAGWLRHKTLKDTKKVLLKEVSKASQKHYEFYTFEVTSIRKAPKDMLVNYRLNQYEMKKPKKPEQFAQTFYEDHDWLQVDPVPWSTKTGKTPEGKDRNTIENMWHNWNIEFSNDLYSLLGNIGQNSDRFSEESRGKQRLCNLVTCIVMLEIYDFEEWNSAIVDSILVNGDQYFHECMDELTEENYEISMEDLKDICTVFPFQANLEWNPIVEGTMFLVRNTQFNLYKALRLFFNGHNRRSGILHCSKSEIDKKQVTIGKTKPKEYFMFDCDSNMGHMFLEGQERAYILRCTSLNRLLHVLTLTLRGGDFYLYEVKVTNLKPL